MEIAVAIRTNLLDKSAGTSYHRAEENARKNIEQIRSLQVAVLLAGGKGGQAAFLAALDMMFHELFKLGHLKTNP